jgi:ubiquinone/menaquinone biosynthesis C-methylase UbiE
VRNFRPDTYGEAIAPAFDTINDDPEQVASIVKFLVDHAGNGPVLEPGIGTGRVGIPFAETGLPVYGVEISDAMVEQLRGKPGAERVTVEVGDMTEVDFGQSFSLVYLAQGTFSALLSEERQRQFLRHARNLVADGARLVVETFEIDDTQFRDDQYVTVSMMDTDHLVLSAATREPDVQIVSMQNILLTTQGNQLFPMKFRYYSAAELDEMAADAHFRLVERYADWDKAEYAPGDRRHISVFVAVPPG